MKSMFRPLLAPLLLIASLLPLACSAAPAPSYTEGKQYAKVKEAIPPADRKKITVEEFFWYGCPHCFHADPVIETWKAKKAADVDFQRIPNTLGRPDGDLHARAFYIAESLGVNDKIHKPLFELINVKRQPMNTPDSIRALFASAAGVSSADFDRATSSFMVDSRMRRAETLARTYQITSVPALVVGGKYTTSPAMAGDPAKAMAVVDFLIDKLRKERK